MVIVLTAVVFAVIGLALGGGGTRLLLLGGSPYYLIAGLGFLLTAFLLFRRRAAALWVYALVVLGSLAWAIWEVGFDWWQLGPRGGVIILLGLWAANPMDPATPRLRQPHRRAIWGKRLAACTGEPPLGRCRPLFDDAGPP
ncbi:probabable glucose dehydrogenase (pyrroloquinoline- quinone) protein [Sinorhizobium meliloti SM11]|uniref:Probabable glucose dehydrogenase (Pyrroloquinoline-quinone) protein n=1 Tax=Sinorhizobium meliloti (strain SM11) TaxID=707241 RepID=F7WZX7_SINMM|nr:probabable glucose dehydrogenase (pyrroloquinoline- quinone) protein [Sinorhizobium meliloti SM11]